ncbi:MAG: hypothetical protein ACN2B6_01285 [Rickettsiales bacterium]
MPNFITIDDMINRDGSPFSGSFQEVDVLVNGSYYTHSNVSAVNGEITFSNPIIDSAQSGDIARIHLTNGRTGAKAHVLDAVVSSSGLVTATLSANAASYNEGEMAIFTITIDASTTEDLDFDISYSGVSQVDYFGQPSSVTIPSGDTQVSFSVFISDDFQTEGVETLTVNIVSSQATIGTGQVSVDINDSSITAASVSQPSITTAQSGSGIQVDWGADANAANFRVHYGPVDGDITTATVAGNILTYTTGALSTGEYSVYVEAVDSNGNSVFSNIDTITLV